MPVGPVSYTHLDVYKRQRYAVRAGQVREARCRLDDPRRADHDDEVSVPAYLDGLVEFPCRKRLFEPHHPRTDIAGGAVAAAVSYTHLDVYKRQV